MDLGWRHVTNGKLLALGRTNNFEVFITKDANLPYQQNLTGSDMAILVLKPFTQDYLDLIALTSEVLLILPSLKPGSVTMVTGSRL